MRALFFAAKYLMMPSNICKWLHCNSSFDILRKYCHRIPMQITLNTSRDACVNFVLHEFDDTYDITVESLTF